MFHTFFSFRYAQSRALFFAFLACFYLGLHGQMPESSAGQVLPRNEPVQGAPLRRLTVGMQRRLSRRKLKLNQYRVACRNHLMRFMQQNYRKPFLRTLCLAFAFSLFAEQLLILSLVPLLVWLMGGLSRLHPFKGQPEWLLLYWLLSYCEYALILMIGSFVLFEVAHSHEFSSTPLVLLLNQTSKTESHEKTRIEIARKLAALAA